MKIPASLRVLGVMGFLATTPAWSIPIGTVGSIDTLIAQTQLRNSGDATERAWVASVLNLDLDDLVYEEKTDVSMVDWERVTGTFAGVWAFELSGPTDWFLIKTGNIGGGQKNRHFLFNNLGNLDYAVVRLLDMGITNVSNVSKISHVGEFSGTSREVPEPGPLALLGMGLLGLGLARRKTKHA